MQLTTLIVTALASFLIATTAKADRPYVGRWEHRTEHGFLETAEFTADGRFSFLYFPNSTMEGTYREIRPGILRLKLTNSDVLGNDLGSGEMTIQWEIDNGCLIETYENGNSFKYFPVLETEEESSIDSEKQSRGATTPPIATPAPRATPGDEFGTRLILAVRSALDSHDWKALTGMTVEGETNYFGHQNATDDYIAGDMQSDSRRYGISYAFGLMAITQLPLPAFCTMTRACGENDCRRRPAASTEYCWLAIYGAPVQPAEPQRPVSFDPLDSGARHSTIVTEGGRQTAPVSVTPRAA